MRRVGDRVPYDDRAPYDDRVPHDDRVPYEDSTDGSIASMASSRPESTSSGDSGNFFPEHAILRHPEPNEQRDLIWEVAQRDLELEDDCDCYCSSSGCLPTHMIPALDRNGAIKS